MVKAQIVSICENGHAFLFLAVIMMQCLSNFGAQYGLFTSLFLAGLVGGATHCSFMCGPFVLAQMKGQNKGDVRLSRPSSWLMLPYHLGRMTTYVGLAVLFSSVLNLAFLFSDKRTLVAAPLLMTAAVIFLVSAFPGLTSLFPWVSKIRFPAPKGILQNYAEKLMRGEGSTRQYLLGVLLGFMPCGLVVSALLAASSVSDITTAGLAMGAFTIGTLPSLAIVALGGHSLRIKYADAGRYLSKGAMVISSLWLFILAGILIF